MVGVPRTEDWRGREQLEKKFWESAESLLSVKQNSEQHTCENYLLQAPGKNHPKEAERQKFRAYKQLGITCFHPSQWLFSHQWNVLCYKMEKFKQRNTLSYWYLGQILTNNVTDLFYKCHNRWKQICLQSGERRATFTSCRKENLLILVLELCREGNDLPRQKLVESRVLTLSQTIFSSLKIVSSYHYDLY